MGRKAYLSNYLRLPLKERQKLYSRVIPRLTIFAEAQVKTQDILHEGLKKNGLTDAEIADVLERLDLK